MRAKQGITEILIHTGQHYNGNMSDVFYDELEMPGPDYHLGIGGDTHGAQTGRMLEVIEAVLVKEKLDWALVYGETNSTLAGALLLQSSKFLWRMWKQAFDPLTAGCRKKSIGC